MKMKGLLQKLVPLLVLLTGFWAQTALAQDPLYFSSPSQNVLNEYSVNTTTSFTYIVTANAGLPKSKSLPLTVSLQSAAGLTRNNTVTDNCGARLWSGHSCTIKVDYTPTAAGTVTQLLSIGYGWRGPLVSDFDLTAVVSDSLKFTAQPSATVETVVGGTSTLNYTIENDGGGPINSLTILSPVSASKVTRDNTVGDNCVAPLAQGATCNIRYTYAPTANTDDYATFDLAITYGSGSTLTSNSIQLTAFTRAWTSYTSVPFSSGVESVVGYGSGTSEQIYLGLRFNGIYFTQNGASSWAHITSSSSPPITNNFVNSVYAIGSDASARIYVGMLVGGLTEIAVDGPSFTHKSFTPNNDASAIYATLLDSQYNIYVGTADSLHVSRNGGAWTSYLSGKNINGVFADADAGTERIFVGTTTGLWVSLNGGTNWTQYLASSTVNGVYVVGTGSSTKIYVATGNGLYISDDSTHPNFTFTAYTNSTDPGLPSSVSNKVNSVFAIGSGASEHIYAATDDGLAVTRDGNKAQSAWSVYKTTAPANLPNNIVNSVYGDGTGANEHIYVGTTGGLAVERAQP